MSTNIDHVECLSGELTISEEGKRWVDRFDNDCEPSTPNDPRDDHWPEIPPEVEETEDGRSVVAMGWSGEGSGNAMYYGALEKFFSFTRGTAEFVFYWEGMGCEGVRVVDGKMTKHEVEMRLGKEVK